jgi:hypothetical protein
MPLYHALNDQVNLSVKLEGGLATFDSGSHRLVKDCGSVDSDSCRAKTAGCLKYGDDVEFACAVLRAPTDSQNPFLRDTLHCCDSTFFDREDAGRIAVVGMQPEITVAQPEITVAQPYTVNMVTKHVCTGEDVEHSRCRHDGPVTQGSLSTNSRFQRGVLFATATDGRILDTGTSCTDEHIIGFDKIKYLRLTQNGVEYALWGPSDPRRPNDLQRRCTQRF